MATRSTIAIERADGSIVGVYCHWDGYLSYNGKILQENYNTPETVEELIAHGHISSLGSLIGETHPFDPGYGEQDPVKAAERKAAYEAAQEAGWTTFYHRDRGEPCKKFTYICRAEYELAEKEEYNYLFRDGKWIVSFYGEKNRVLSEALAEDKETQENCA